MRYATPPCARLYSIKKTNTVISQPYKQPLADALKLAHWHTGWCSQSRLNPKTRATPAYWRSSLLALQPTGTLKSQTQDGQGW
jgi:hypothetical protein